MTFRHLEAFVQVARKGGFTRAAEALYLTQPTVSGQIKELEQELGLPLFHRLPRAVELTEAGGALLAQAREILGARERLLEQAAAYRGLLWGRLELVASTIPGEYLLPPLLAAFKQRRPEIAVALRVSDSAEVLRTVASGEACLGVAGEKAADAGLESAPLWTDRVTLYAAGQWLPDGPLSVDALRQLPVVVREEGSGTRRAAEEFLRQVGLGLADLRVVGEFGSATAVKEAVKAGLGAGFLSDVAVAGEVGRGGLRPVIVEGAQPMLRRFFAVWDGQRALTPAAREFLDDLLAVVAR
ncbi:MAG: selenium metabolism-associated LysR family transcriptional regulator [Deferrisomatales bacterium]